MIVVLIINLYFLFSAHNQPLVLEDQKEKDKQKVWPNIQKYTQKKIFECQFDKCG